MVASPNTIPNQISRPPGEKLKLSAVCSSTTPTTLLSSAPIGNASSAAISQLISPSNSPSDRMICNTVPFEAPMARIMPISRTRSIHSKLSSSYLPAPASTLPFLDIVAPGEVAGCGVQTQHIAV
jgi:hypothetical protein